MENNLNRRVDVIEQIGKNIQKLRKERNLKGEILAKSLGVTKAAFSYIENGLVDYKISTLQKIAKVLDTDVKTLIEGEQSATQSLKTQFEDYRFESERHIRTVNILICRIEFLNEKIECLSRKQVG